MQSHGRPVFIYAIASRGDQSRLAHELTGLGRLGVQTPSKNGNHFVVIQSDEGVPPSTIHELVMSIAPNAELVDTHVDSPLGRRRAQLIRGRRREQDRDLESQGTEVEGRE